jgi:phytoene desaturase
LSRIAVIGAGFAGLSAASYLSKAGHEVHVFEKNSEAGGRARQLREGGYVFDMGPSWYWMPGVFEDFFNDFGYQVSDLYKLHLLNPSFEMVFEGSRKMIIPADYQQLKAVFESVEKGSSEQLDKFMDQAQMKYEAAMNKMVMMPGLSLREFADPSLLKMAMGLDIFSSFSRHVRKFFSHPALIALMEFPILFLGAMPRHIPALYSLMNYAGLKLGTWYPEGGFGSVIEAMKKLAMLQGAKFHFNASVEKIKAGRTKVSGIIVDGGEICFDAVVSTADYHHTESLLPERCRNYPGSYWEKKTFAPSCLIFYVGINKKIPALQHHTMFFEADLEQHSREIYEDPQWPSRPLFYVSCTSKTDPATAPEGHENLFLLMPIAIGLDDAETVREKYFEIMMERLEKFTGETGLLAHIDYKKSYCVSDFMSDYHSYKGNAYGLANTLRQTAIFKPKMRNKKLGNLFYAGQLTVPGPGVPPCIISGKIAAQQLEKYLKRYHEAIV